MLQITIAVQTPIYQKLIPAGRGPTLELASE